MGYNSGRTGDQTKFLLNKVDNHALYKGTVRLENDVPASLAANALIVGVGSDCEITDEITDSSLRDKNAIVNISAMGKAILVPVNGQVVTTEGDQTISSVKKITSTFNNGIGKLEIGKIEGSGAPGTYYKRGTLTATENGLLKWIGNTTDLGLTLTADGAGGNQFTISETYGHAPSLNLQWFGVKDGTTHTYVSYIDFPGDKGTSSSPATLATTEDCGTKLYKHKIGNLIIISPQSTAYDIGFSGGAYTNIVSMWYCPFLNQGLRQVISVTRDSTTTLAVYYLENTAGGLSAVQYSLDFESNQDVVTPL